MILNLYSIRDNLAEVFNKPFTSINDATAKRAFIGSMQQAEHKDDYALYAVGSYNDASGELNGHPPVRIMAGLEVTIQEDVIDSVTPSFLQEQAG